MENFADSLESASCAEAMILRFQDTDVYQAAQNSWNWVNLGPNRTFIMVGDPELCQSGNSRDPWAVTAADFDEATLTIRLTAKEKMWGEVAYSYVIEFGTPSQNLRKRWDDQFGFPVDMTSSWPSSLISKDGSPYYKFGIDCVDCGIEGAIDITGHIAGKYVTPTEVAISVSPRGLKAEANFEVTLEGTLEDYQVTDDKEIKRIALSPYSIPKILNFGPELIFKVGYELGDIEGKAKLSTGMVAEVPNESSFEVDILPPRIQKPAGWVPTFTAKPLTLDATISAEMSFFLSTGLGVTIVALPCKLNLALVRSAFLKQDSVRRRLRKVSENWHRARDRSQASEGYHKHRGRIQ